MTRRRLGRGEGQALILVILTLPLFFSVCALVVDGTGLMVNKRQLQNGADATALAAAQSLVPANGSPIEGQCRGDYPLPPEQSCLDVLDEYRIKNGVPTALHACSDADPSNPTDTNCYAAPYVDKSGTTHVGKIEVRVKTPVSGFFASLAGVQSFFDVGARAVATAIEEPIEGEVVNVQPGTSYEITDPSTTSTSFSTSISTTTTGTPYAMFVHELCGAGGNKGLFIAGDDARIEGAIHVNGQFKVGNPGLQTWGTTKVFRPPHADSPTPPTQGTCNGSGTPRIENHGTARYNCGVYPACTVYETTPMHGPYTDWATDYARNGTDYTKAQIPCTINAPGDVTFSTNNGVVPSGVYCLPAGKEFKITGNNMTGNFTVFADKIFIGGVGGTFLPFNPAHPVLLYSTSAIDTILNPSGAVNWEGYIINRFGGIIVNASGITSPQAGLLEAEWIVVNGAGFRMLGQGPPGGGTVSTSTTTIPTGTTTTPGATQTVIVPPSSSTTTVTIGTTHTYAMDE